MLGTAHLTCGSEPDRESNIAGTENIGHLILKDTFHSPSGMFSIPAELMREWKISQQGGNSETYTYDKFTGCILMVTWTDKYKTETEVLKYITTNYAWALTQKSKIKKSEQPIKGKLTTTGFEATSYSFDVELENLQVFRSKLFLIKQEKYYASIHFFYQYKENQNELQNFYTSLNEHSIQFIKSMKLK